MLYIVENNVHLFDRGAENETVAMAFQVFLFA